MRIYTSMLGILLFGLLLAPGATEQSTGLTVLQAGAARQAADGAQILERSCTACHDLSGVAAFAESGEQATRDLISTMVGYGATVADDELDVLVAHILAAYGPGAGGQDGPGAGGQEAPAAFDEAAGMALVNAKCTTCHDGTVMGERGAFPPDQWVETVDRMMEYGLALTEDEYNLILTTLGTPAGESPAGAEAAEEEAAAFDEAAAAALVTARCTTCHDDSSFGERGAYPPEQWAETVDRMMGYGLALTEDEYDTILLYLGTPPGEADAFDTAAAESLLNSACTTCHDLTAITSAPPGSFTEAEYRDTIIRMMGYGLSITDADVDMLVRYLTETYGEE